MSRPPDGNRSTMDEENAPAGHDTVMLLNLHKLKIDLHSDSRLIRRNWEHLFGSWLAGSSVHPTETQGDIELSLALSEKLPPLPLEEPFFEDPRPLPDDIGILSAYHGPEDHITLHYLDGALVTLSLTDPSESPPLTRARITGSLTPAALAYGRFEDINYTSMAPFLRRQGYFLLHAFAAAKDGRAVIISGKSGSGKTTSGLALVLNGWQLLSNDILLLEARADGIYALPTPGGVGIRPFSLELLPELKQLVADTPLRKGSYDISSHQLSGGAFAPATKVSHIYFPEITPSGSTTLRPARRAFCLARLMEESIDRWDAPMLGPHISFLETLCHQARVNFLQLGQDVGRLPEML